MFDANGEWLETELETAKGLNRLLCRPVKHLWLDTPEARSRHGQVRRREGQGLGEIVSGQGKLLWDLVKCTVS